MLDVFNAGGMGIQWPLVLFAVFNGAGGWLIASTAVNELRGKSKSASARQLALILGMILVVVGGICSALHLTHIERIMGALSHPTSGIFTEALLTGLLFLAALVYLVLAKREAGQGAVKGMAVVSGILGVLLPFATGYSYLMAARPTWNTIVFPFACLAVTAVSGIALYLLVLALKDKEATEALNGAGMATAVAAVCAIVLSLAYAGAAGALTGDGAVLLWLGTVVIGGIVPAVCGALVKRGKSVETLSACAVVGAVIGSVCFRCFQWIIGTGILTLIGDGNWFSSI